MAWQGPEQGRLALSVDEVVHALHLSERTVRAAIARGDLVVTRIGRRVLITRPQLERWLAKNERAAV